MSLAPIIEYDDAPYEVRAVYDEIMALRKTDWINNFWKVLANDPKTLRRIWDNVKQVMAPGALDPLVKEMVYIGVSATNNCEYCTYSHTAAARAKGMNDAMWHELMAVVALANATNRLANGYRIPVDERFVPSFAKAASGAAAGINQRAQAATDEGPPATPDNKVPATTDNEARATTVNKGPATGRRRRASP